MKLFMGIFLMCMLSTAMASTTATDTVYQCRDGKGKKVFQQVPCNENKLVINNAFAYSLWKQMRILSIEGKNILSNLSGDVASIKMCNQRIGSFNAKVSALDNDIRHLNKNYVEIIKAQSYLKDCGVCRTSAESNCRTADKYLEKAVAKLTKY